MRLKKKYLIGKEYKGFRRYKGDDQPGRKRKKNPGLANSGKNTLTVPAKGRKFRHPQQPPGYSRGKPEKVN